MPSTTNPNALVTGAGLHSIPAVAGAAGSVAAPSTVFDEDVYVDGQTVRDIFQSGLVNAGGLGTLAELGGNTLDVLLTSIDLVARRRRAFTATVAELGSPIRKADLESDSLDSLWDILSDQVAGETGGVFFVHARSVPASTSYTVAAMSSTQSPYLIAEQRNKSTIAGNSAQISDGVPVEPAGVLSTINGTWDGFRFRRSASNTFRVRAGFKARDCQIFDPVFADFAGNTISPPYVFERCHFTGESSNTGYYFNLLGQSDTAITAVFQDCQFEGPGTGNTTVNCYLANLNVAGAFNTTLARIVFRNCQFSAQSSLHALELYQCKQTIIFENCTFAGNNAATGLIRTVNVRDCQDVRFRGCKFVNSQKPMFWQNSGGTIENCVFAVAYNLSLTSDISIDVQGSYVNNPLVMLNNRVLFSGTFGILATPGVLPSPAIHINMLNTTVDGLYIQYDSALAADRLHGHTLNLDYSGAAFQSAAARNVYIDVNTKTCSGNVGNSGQFQGPSILTVTDADEAIYQTIHNVKIVNVGRGNSGDVLGDQGSIIDCDSASRIVFDDLEISGPGLLLADGMNRAWENTVRGATKIVHGYFPPSPDLGLYQGVVSTTGITCTGEISEISHSYFEARTEFQASGAFLGGYVQAGKVVDNTFKLDPLNGHPIIGSLFDGGRISGNDFSTTESVSVDRNANWIHAVNNNMTICQNYVEWCTTAFPGYYAIRSEGDYCMVSDNVINELEAGTSISVSGTGSVSTDNITTGTLTSVETEIDDLQANAALGRISIPITSWRLTTGAALPAFNDGVDDGLHFVGGAEAFGYRINPASTTTIVCSIPLPDDLNEAVAIQVHFIAARIGAVDTTTVITVGAFFNSTGAVYTAGSNVGGNTTAIAGATTVVSDAAVTIAAGNVPVGAVNLTLTALPDNLTTDDLIILSTYIEFSRLV